MWHNAEIMPWSVSFKKICVLGINEIGIAVCYIYLNLGATPILEGDPEIWHQKGGAGENSN